MSFRNQVFGLGLTFIAVGAWAQVSADNSYSYKSGDRYLRLELWAPDLIHAEYGVSQNTYPAPIRLSPMVYSPESLKKAGKAKLKITKANKSGKDVLTTGALELSVDPNSLCLRVTDTLKGQYLTTLCPDSLDQWVKNLQIDASQFENAYGLGENFKKLGSADGDWVEHGARNSMAFGNGFQTFQEAAIGNIQIPILYGLSSTNTFGLFLDNIYKQDWTFTNKSSWNAQMRGDQIRFFLLAGKDLKEVRRKYMDLTGHPPVPPKKTFGLWMSKFGYHSWKEIDQTKDQLRKRGFPFDGFVLDINWFGGLELKHPEKSRMGLLDWDQDPNDGNDNYFPDPANKVKTFAKENIGFTLIEDSYISATTPTYQELFKQRFFTFNRDGAACNPTGDRNPVWLKAWWGNGGMIDWSNPGVGKWMHENRRLPNIIRLGVTNHWTDLGEPEMFNPDACYMGVEPQRFFHQDVNNLYNFLWNKSIWDGYRSFNTEINKRPFILARSGASGVQRFGVGIWSADIASNLQSLATHMNAQMHMALSGIDYFSSDAGGYRKEVMPGNDKSGKYRGYENEMYSMWFANSAWFDVPLRPHTDNDFSMAYAPTPLWPPYETAPYLVGKEYTNKMNVRQRYELIPYYYSLAYKAYLSGDAVMPPLVYNYQADKRLRTVGHQKMLGDWMMIGVVASHGEYARSILLPQDGWYNYHTNEYFDGRKKSSLTNFPVYIDEVLRLPTFVREGAILPLMKVTNNTQDVFNHQTSGGIDNDLIVRVYAGADNSFTLYEDDGLSQRFLGDKPIYETKTTILSQVGTTKGLTVTIDKSQGGKTAEDRNMTVVVVANNKKATSVTLNGVALPALKDITELSSAEKGWALNGQEVVVKLGKVSSSLKKIVDLTMAPSDQSLTSAYFVCKNGWTNMGENIAIVGEVEKLGSYSAPIKMEPSIYYDYIFSPPPYSGLPGPKSPIWTKLIKNVPRNQQVSWSCAKLASDGTILSRSTPQMVNIKDNYSGAFEGTLGNK